MTNWLEAEAQRAGLLTETDARRTKQTIAVVIPCYRVSRKIADLLRRIGPEVSAIYCVDDGCPEGSGLAAHEVVADDKRIRVLTHAINQGVGGAVITGYRQALADGADVIVKLDGDGQMAPEEIERLAGPVLRGDCDYSKGNRFFHIESLRRMPWIRIFGNAGLSFLTKLSTGYWNLFDPTNGYTALDARIAKLLPLDQLSQRYFFESDMLFRLNTFRAVVQDVPLDAIYCDEKSNLNVLECLIKFPVYHACNLLKRLFYNYFLRDFNLASLHLMLGLVLLTLGTAFGVYAWVVHAIAREFASSGTVMFASLPIILGVQLILNFVSFDMANVPQDPIHRRL